MEKLEKKGLAGFEGTLVYLFVGFCLFSLLMLSS